MTLKNIVLAISLLEALFPATSALADHLPSDSCRAFADHVLKTKTHSNIEEIRLKNSIVETGSMDSSRPYITVQLKRGDTARSPTMLELRTSQGETPQSWLLDLVVPPMEMYRYRFSVQEGHCLLESIEVNKNGKNLNREKCAHLTAPGVTLKEAEKWTAHACALGMNFFPKPVEKNPTSKPPLNYKAGGAS